MRTLVWILTGITLAIWSGFAWIAHALVGLSGNVLASNADLLPATPEVIELASWLANLGTGLGEWFIVAVWLVISAIILAMGFLLAQLFPRRRIPVRN